MLPMVVFARGDIVAYLPEYRAAPTDAQLDRLTHLVLFSAIPGDGGRLAWANRTNWARTDADVNAVVTMARARGVKVIIALGGWGRTGTFPQSVRPTARQTFVNHIMDFVRLYNLDGVDIDWEYPTTDQERSDFEGFMIALKAALGENRRLSFAIGAQYAPTFYSAATFAAMDALHLMTYDGQTNNRPHHADMAWSKGVVDTWINSGRIARHKIFYGVPFYGRGGGEFTYAQIIQPDPNRLSQTNTNGVTWYDGVPQIREKTNFAWERNIGGIMIWELQQDVVATSEHSLLNTIFQETQRLAGLNPTNRRITVTHNTGGTVRNGNTTINSGGHVEIANGGSVTLTFTANSGFVIGDVRINGVSNSAARNSGTHTFSNVTSNQTLDVVFARRHNVPGNIHACEFSQISQIASTTNKEQCEGDNIGWLENGSFVEYLLNVNGAGNYKISVETANGNNAARAITIRNGNSSLGTINVPAGSNWTSYSVRDADVTLPTGNVTLRFSVDGPVNFRNISITRVGGGELCVTCGKNPCECNIIIPSDDPDLANGEFEWNGMRDNFGTGSNASATTAPANIGFNVTVGTTVSPNYAWAKVVTYSGGDWSGVTSINISYTSNAAITLTLVDNNGWDEQGRGFHVELPSGTHTRTIPITDFRQINTDWQTYTPIQLSQRQYFEGVSITPTSGGNATGTVTVLIVNGLTYGGGTAILQNERKASNYKMGASIVNGQLNLSLPTGADNATVTLFDVRGRILLHENVRLNTGVASLSLPNHVARNQVTVLQVKTSTGVNLTRRIMVKQ